MQYSRGLLRPTPHVSYRWHVDVELSLVSLGLPEHPESPEYSENQLLIEPEHPSLEPQRPRIGLISLGSRPPPQFGMLG